MMKDPRANESLWGSSEIDELEAFVLCFEREVQARTPGVYDSVNFRDNRFCAARHRDHYYSDLVGSWMPMDPRTPLKQSFREKSAIYTHGSLFPCDYPKGDGDEAKNRAKDAKSEGKDDARRIQSFSRLGTVFADIKRAIDAEGRTAKQDQLEQLDHMTMDEYLFLKQKAASVGDDAVARLKARRGHITIASDAAAMTHEIRNQHAVQEFDPSKPTWAEIVPREFVPYADDSQGQGPSRPGKWT